MHASRLTPDRETFGDILNIKIDLLLELLNHQIVKTEKSETDQIEQI